MSKINPEELSEAEALELLTQYEKREVRWKNLGLKGTLIGAIGAALFAVMEVEALSFIFTLVLLVGVGFIVVGGRFRSKAESVVNAQLYDFYEAELQKAFGPCQHTEGMDINEPLLKELRVVDEGWSEHAVWRFYEGDYHGTHFSVENVKLGKEVYDGENGDRTVEIFDGAVLRCKDVCHPALDIALCGPGTDHQSDLTDPAVFRQSFSARTADGQPADHLVTPKLRELIQKMEFIGTQYTVTALLFRNGEAMLAIRRYNFGYALQGDKSLRDLDAVRKRFIDSLTPVCKLIDILRDSCGKL